MSLVRMKYFASDKQKASTQGYVTAADVRVHSFPSELGWMAAAWCQDRLCRFAFGQTDRIQSLRALAMPLATSAEGERACDAFADRLRNFAAGEPDDLSDIVLDFHHCTPFQRHVLEFCRQIGRGETLSYGDLARRAGRPAQREPSARSCLQTDIR